MHIILFKIDFVNCDPSGRQLPARAGGEPDCVSGKGIFVN